MTKEEYDKICDYLRDVIQNTSWEGKVYTVGGCLRDIIMGRDIHDVDLAVAVPDGGVKFPLWLEKKGLTLVAPTLYRRFSSSRLRLKKFPEDEIEVVQTRREQYTDANSRNPEVCFGSLKDDCERRDLTINSLYQNVSTGELLDLTGRGVDDIKNLRIRTPMAPQDTYSDDPIRILRTLRFAVRYGWEIPEDLWKAMKDNAGRMKIVRRPRVSTEFEKMLMSNDPVKLLKMMKDLGVIYRVLPELCHLFRLKDHSRKRDVERGQPLPTLWDSTMEKLQKVVGSTEDSLEARFAALFSHFDKVRISYSQNKDELPCKSEKSRNAVITIALRRLIYDYSFINRVKALFEEGNAVKKKERDKGKRNYKNHRRRRGKKKDGTT